MSGEHHHLQTAVLAALSYPCPTGACVQTAQMLCVPPGTAVMFHQGVYHCNSPNYGPNRYIAHMVYSPPWLVRSGRMESCPEFEARTTERRRLLLGDFRNGAGRAFGTPAGHPIPRL